MKKLTVLVLTMFATLVHADYNYPKAIPCTEPRPNMYNVCALKDMPQQETTVYTDARGVQRVTQEYTIVEAICFDGVCQTYKREYMGRSPHDRRYNIHKKYYIGPGADGKDWAYLRGTGPEYDNFIAGSAKVTAEAPATAGVFDIWCNPQGDLCETDKGKFSRKELPKHFPMADPAEVDIWCDMEVCYNPKNKIVGLNPDYSGYYN